MCTDQNARVDESAVLHEESLELLLRPVGRNARNVGGRQGKREEKEGGGGGERTIDTDIRVRLHALRRLGKADLESLVLEWFACISCEKELQETFIQARVRTTEFRDCFLGGRGGTVLYEAVTHTLTGGLVEHELAAFNLAVRLEHGTKTL
jgi:hypothetical protein